MPYLQKYRQSKHIPVQEEKGFHISQFIDGKALPISILTLLFALGYASLIAFLNFFAEERDLLSASSFFFLAYAISSSFHTSIYRLYDGYKRS